MTSQRARQSAISHGHFPQNGLVGSGCGTFVPHFLQVRRASSFQKSSIAWLKCSHDVAAIEVDVFDERAAIFAIKNDVLVFAGRTAAFDHHPERVGRTHWRVRTFGGMKNVSPSRTR